MLVAGVGTGLFNPALTAVALGSAPVEQSGLAAGTNDTFRQAGIAIGVAALGALVPAGAAFDPTRHLAYVDGLHDALWVGAAVAFVGAVAAAALIRRSTVKAPRIAAELAPEPGVAPPSDLSRGAARRVSSRTPARRASCARGRVSDAPAAVTAAGGMPRRALVVIDMINPYDHADADRLARSVGDGRCRRSADSSSGARARRRAGHLRQRQLRSAGGPTATTWSSAALRGQLADLVEPIRPRRRLDVRGQGAALDLLRHAAGVPARQEGIDRIVLIGQVTEQCILYSALDAHVRHLDGRRPARRVAHIHEDLADAALA